MDYSRLQRSINFKHKHMRFFQENSTDIQEFTRAAVDEKIEKLRSDGQRKTAGRAVDREIDAREGNGTQS